MLKKIHGVTREMEYRYRAEFDLLVEKYTKSIGFVPDRFKPAIGLIPTGFVTDRCKPVIGFIADRFKSATGSNADGFCRHRFNTDSLCSDRFDSDKFCRYPIGFQNNRFCLSIRNKGPKNSPSLNKCYPYRYRTLRFLLVSMYEYLFNNF